MMQAVGLASRSGVLTQSGPEQIARIDTSRTSPFADFGSVAPYTSPSLRAGPRSYWFDGRGLHATAVLRETRSGKKGPSTTGLAVTGCCSGSAAM
jgi:hypothetical protein